MKSICDESEKPHRFYDYDEGIAFVVHPVAERSRGRGFDQVQRRLGERGFDRDGNVILEKDSHYFLRRFYPTFCTHWKNGSIKTKRVYEIRIGR